VLLFLFMLLLSWIQLRFSRTEEAES
jgi:hypothetical protein